MDRPIFRNQILLQKETGEQYRVLWISPDSQYAYWISMESRSTMPERAEMRTIQEMLDYGALEEHEEMTPVNMTLTAADQERRDRLWRLLKEALLDEPWIYERHKRAEHLKRIAAESGLRMTNLYRYLAEYWKGGQTPDAFVTHYKKCGGKGKSRSASVKKLGRPSQSPLSFGKKLQEQDFRNWVC